MTKSACLPFTLRFGALLLLLGFSCTGASAAGPLRQFDVPAGDAIDTLRQAARQAGVEIMFPVANVKGVRTSAVKGEFTPRAALERMLEGTGLMAVEDEKTGALAVKRNPDPNVQGAAPEAMASDRPDLGARADAGIQKLAAYEVTGSHIKRLEGEGPQPVTSYSGSDMEAHGFDTTAEFLQSLSFNSGTTNNLSVPAVNPISNAPFARGASTLNPRGLGANRFLVLIDGQRPATYGLADTSGGSEFDFNSIPLEAIESIDYLKDGASAIYGSDAIGGVMNIKLKGSYSGLTTKLEVGSTLGHGAGTRGLSVITGDSGARGSYLLNLNWFKQDQNFLNQYSRSQSTDFSQFPGPRAQNNNSTSNFPFNITLTAAQAAAAGLTTGAGAYVIAGGQPVASPTLASFSYIGSSVNNATDANRYEFAPVTQLTPAQDNISMLLNVKRTFSGSFRGYSEVLFNRNLTDIVYTPISISSTAIPVSINPNDGTLFVPAGNPYNPFGQALSNFRGRGNFGPTRTFDVDSTGLTGLFGTEGDLPHDWKWNTHFVYGFSRVDQVAGGQIENDSLQEALNGTLPGYQGAFLNPFGPSSNPAMVASLFVNSNSSSETRTIGGGVDASGPLMTVPELLGLRSAGQVSLAVGAEWRQDRLENDSDPNLYLVSTGASPYGGQRTVDSAYAEVSAPILPKYLEVQAAGRYDNYNTFGGTLNPKYSFISEPLAWLKIRGSYSASFKAPDLGELYEPSVETFTTAIVDPRNPGLGTNIYPFYTSGNPKLHPEKGRTWYGGVVLDAGRLIRGLSISFDYLDINLTNAITTFSSPITLLDYYPNLVNRVGGSPGNGQITSFNAETINAAGIQWKGFDLGAQFEVSRTQIGSFRFSGEVTYIDVYALNAGAGAGLVNQAGQYNNPRWAGSGQVAWKEGRWGAALGAQFKGGYLNNQFAPAFEESTLFLYNGSVSCNLPWRTKLTLGCDNLLNKFPPENGKAIPSYGFDIATYQAWSLGRFIYVKLAKDF